MRSKTAFLTVLFLLLTDGATAGNDGLLTAIIIPGFASTNLNSRSIYDCPDNSLQFERLAFVYHQSNFNMALSSVDCWIKCMSLDPYDQTDHPQCRSWPATGLSGITELDPGFLTGPPSNIWKEWLSLCVDLEVEAVAAPYDWRLSPTQMEDLDLYFQKLLKTFETARKKRGRPSIVFAHSLGNNVFRYFLEWLRQEIPPESYMRWLDQHIDSYFALGAPFLGSVEIIKSTLIGEQPITEEYLRSTEPNTYVDYYNMVLSGRITYPDFLFKVLRLQGTARLMFNSFPSSLWMLPFPNLKTEDKWPTNILKIEIPYEKGNLTCALLTQTFTARKIGDGTFFKAIAHWDPDSKRVLHQLKRLYHEDPILNPLTPWERPPIKNVYCIYGINSLTEVGYYVTPSDKSYPNNWILKDVIYETEGNPGPSGDGKVPYASLSWCRNWLGPKVNITTAPQVVVYNQSHVNVELNVDNIPKKVTKGSRGKYMTFYEDSQSIRGKKTAIWEVDKANHWKMINSLALMREVSLQIWQDFQSNPLKKFVKKANRGPLRDADCYWDWDYEKFKCARVEDCNRRCRLCFAPYELVLEYV